MKITQYKAFTMVEIVVACVILSILATIAFLTFSNQSSTARDSTRLSDVSNIIKGLATFNLEGLSYPYPDRAVNIMSGTTQIGYQGEAGLGVLKIIGFSASRGIDPLDKTFYTYNTNVAKNKAQLLCFLENKSNVVFDKNPFDGISQSFATDYPNRYLYELGDNLGIIVSTYTATGGANSGTLIYTPLQDKISTGSGLNTLSATNSTGMIVVIDNTMDNTYVTTTFFDGYAPGDGESLSGTRLATKKTTADCDITKTIMYGTEDGTDVGLTCNDDIIICNGITSSGYALAACNVGATVVYSGQTFASGGAVRNATVNSWAGGYYQWGRNDEISYSTYTGSTYSGTLTSSGYLGNEYFFKGHLAFWDWYENEAGSSTPTRWTGTNVQGPCPNNYHIPTQNEWQGIINAGTGIYWTANGVPMKTVLKMPFAGYRVYNTGLIINESSYTNLWSVTPDGFQSYALGFGYTNLNPANPASRGSGLSMRCLKN